jgi:hypothetical protein
MTNGEPRPVARDHAPEQKELREQIDALDEQAEAVVEGETPADESESEDVVPSHPAPEPPD